MTNTHTRTCMHTHINTHAHAHTHKHTRTHTRTHARTPHGHTARNAEDAADACAHKCPASTARAHAVHDIENTMHDDYMITKYKVYMCT